MRIIVPAVSAALVGGIIAAGTAAVLASRDAGSQASAVSQATVEARATAPTSDVEALVGADWSGLAAADDLVPGARIRNTTAGITCSAGWILREAHSMRHVVLTAGHCGDVGDTFALPTTGDGERSIGVMTESVSGPGVAADVGLVAVFGDRAAEIGPDPFPLPVSEPSTTTGLRPGADMICRLGYRTGATCGPLETVDHTGGAFVFAGESENGDSGGPVFLLRRGHIVPLGLVTGAPTGDDGRVLAQATTAHLQRRGLEIVSG